MRNQTLSSFLQACLTANREEQVFGEMTRLASAQFEGLGPAADIIYFLHPTVVPPFNTAMVNGFNALFAEKKKFGSCEVVVQLR
jgi:type II restriction enzyme